MRTTIQRKRELRDNINVVQYIFSSVLFHSLSVFGFPFHPQHMALHVASVDRCSSDDLFMSNGGRLLSDSDSSEHKFREQASVSGGARKGAKQFQEDSYFHWISASQAVIVAAVFGMTY